ncbi:bifunctional (p)ppGpp synthetase/guanosine-3',5'-bis(diphosphate) 3'-pyrophosphohydrolase [Candidatus Methylospira mobilis]|uniref:guanosine-3',5'-bis(diphosphate) 3'-diphosphatase n=2 Tax=Candidatus Methylospira mobilis TaxID=1808979 RepID=A0A5Q0BSM4_9GAMM|nr:bifunctional (p)ppGpp synthetase/guanosine-3',5'-bis(diphosphate) 3'-pyrophosphohydrolase [Candidatus Methylospira mobilis]WNV06857.1 bifunctional (p)ppGpp synthetase/guanosine-3',5'-bis(diphosphate) 3'-pyrophosphohydrolase [Candidatus Methylospira mobilis]
MAVPFDIASELPQNKLLRRLNAMLAEYLPSAHLADVQRAYDLAAASHEGQFRVSGEAYICHPVSVAIILAGMRMDARGIIAGLLHDVIEDSAVTKAQLAEQFGDEVANLVDGVSKLTQLDCKSRAEAQAQNLRKMVMAMVKDLRVIMVKLADRLHNMRTLGVMTPERRRRIARETLDIYAPIANRLGMNEVRLELEDLGFSALYPYRYRVLEQAVSKARGPRKEVVGTVEAAITQRLADAGLTDSQVIGREKHLYSIYQKMRGKRRSFAEVFDVYAFRIVINEVDECYRALGITHSLFKPVPGRFKDYIAVPKANGYQSLHTTLVGPDGLPLEIQIRTRSMHQIAESGVAAHWAYKSDDTRASAPITRADEWLRDLVEIQKDAGDSLEFLENLKVDLFQQEVYVLTPKGKIIKLPRGATIVDFAYAVHTDIGNACVSARMDRVLAPLQTILQNGQTVEIITAPWAKPNPLWLNFVVTAKARASIRAYLRHFQVQEAISLGRRLLDKELSEHNRRFEELTLKQTKALLTALDSPSMDQLLEDLGLGNRLPFLVARLLLNDKAQLPAEESEPGEDAPVKHKPLIIKGTEGMVVSLARCCRPIPGDPIVGFFNPGKGIVIHLNECKNVHDLRKKQLNWLDVEWDRHVSGEFSVEVRLELLNQLGTLAKVAAVLSRMHANIENVQINNQDARVSTDIITLQVKDRIHLANVMRELRKLSVVLKISRNKAELRKHK